MRINGRRDAGRKRNLKGEEIGVDDSIVLGPGDVLYHPAGVEFDHIDILSLMPRRESNKLDKFILFYCKIMCINMYTYRYLAPG